MDYKKFESYKDFKNLLNSTEGIKGMSEEDMDALYKRYPKLVQHSVEEQDRLIRNTNIKKHWGEITSFLQYLMPDTPEENFNLNNIPTETADEIYKNWVAYKTFDERLKGEKDLDIDRYSAFWTAEDKINFSKSINWASDSLLEESIGKPLRKQAKFHAENPITSAYIVPRYGASLTDPEINQLIKSKIDEREAAVYDFNAEILKRRQDEQKVKQSVQKYYEDHYLNASSESIDNEFKQIIEPSFLNVGINTYAAYKNEKEMATMSSAEKATILSKYHTYKQLGWHPKDISEALDNEAKDYIYDQQGMLTRVGMAVGDFANTLAVGIGQEINSWQSVGNTVYDMFHAPITLYRTRGEQGEIVPTKDVSQAPDGSFIYKNQNENGEFDFIPVDPIQLNSQAIFLAGYNEDGTYNESWLNPQYLSDAFRFGTFNKEYIKNAKKYGVSLGQPMWGSTAQSNLFYEGFKQTGFATKEVVKAAAEYYLFKGVNRLISPSQKILTSVSKWGDTILQYGNAVSSAGGNAFANSMEVYNEAFAENMKNLTDKLQKTAAKNIQETIKNNPEEFNTLVEAKIPELKEEFSKRRKPSAENEPYLMPSDEIFREYAENMVIDDLTRQEIDSLIANNEEYGKYLGAAYNTALAAAQNQVTVNIPHTVFLNLTMLRSLFLNKQSIIQSHANQIGRRVTVGADGKAAVNSLTKWQKAGILGKESLKVGIGEGIDETVENFYMGGATNYGTNLFNKYLDGTYDAESQSAVSTIIGETMTHLPQNLLYYKAGFDSRVFDENAWYEGVVGFVGGLIPFVNLQGAANYYSQVKQWQKEGYTPSTFEKISQFITSAAINEYYGAMHGHLQNQKFVEEVSKTYEKIDPTTLFKLLQEQFLFKDAGTVDEAKTASFIGLLNTIFSFENASKNPYVLAVLQKVPEFAQTMQLWESLKNDELSRDQVKFLLDMYYKQNPSAQKSKEDNEKALQTVKKNVEDIKEAQQRVKDAREAIDKIKKVEGVTVNEEAENRIITMAALSKKFADRAATIEKEVSGGIENAASAVTELMSYGASGAQVIATLNKSSQSLNKKLSQLEAKITALQEKKEKLDKNDPTYQAQLQQIERDIELEKLEQKHIQHDLDLNESTAQHIVSLEDAIITQFDNENPNNTLTRAQKLKKAFTLEGFFGFKVANNPKSITQIKRFIRELDPRTRARLVASLLTFRNGKSSNFFNNKTGDYLVRALNELIKEDPDIVNKILDMPKLLDHAELADQEIQEAIADPQLFQYKLHKRSIEAFRVARELDIDNIVTNTEKAIQAIDKKVKGFDFNQKQEFIYDDLKTLKEEYLNRLLDRNNASVAKYRQSIERAINHQKTISALIAVAKSQGEENFITTILDAINREEITNPLELLLALKDLSSDENIDDVAKTKYSKLANSLEQYLDQEKATFTETTENKKQREERKNKIRDTHNKRQEEIKKKAEEENKKAQEEKKKEAEQQKEDKKEEPKESAKSKEPSNEPEPSNNDTFVEKQTIDFDDETPPIEKQVAEAKALGRDAEVAAENTKKDVNLFASEEKAEAQSTTVLPGNAMAVYEYIPLKDDGYQIPKKGAKPNDSMSKYFAWMKAANLNPQEVIDTELSEIIGVNNEVHILRVNPQNNATHDNDMGNHSLLVIELTDEVAKIHTSDKNVINANGKKWVVIGTLGYKGNTQKAEYDRVNTAINSRKDSYFRANPSERFYVDTESSTEVVSINSGYLVRQAVGDASVKIRTISELLSDPNRNPDGLKLEDLAWGIAQNGKFVVTGIGNRNYVQPGMESLSNTSGNIYLMIQSSSGIYIPAAIRNVTYAEIKEGELKKTIDGLLNLLTNENIDIRRRAISSLVQMLHFDKNDKTILVGDEKHNTLTIVEGGNPQKTWDISSINKDDFLAAVKALNPRINITLSTLSSPTELQMLDEAGVLVTDIASLRTSGAIYNVYNIGANGKPIKENAITSNPNKSADSDYGRSQIPTVFYNGKTYRFRNNKWRNDTETEEITDLDLLKIIQLNNIIETSNPEVYYEKNGYKYYLLNSDPNNLIIIRRKSPTNFAQQLSQEEAQRMIEGVTKEQQNKEREEAAKEKMEFTDEVPVDFDDETPITEVDKVLADKKEEKKEIKENKKESQTPKPSGLETVSGKSLTALQGDSNLSTATDIINHPEYIDIFNDIIDEKVRNGQWENVPDNDSELLEYLKNKEIAIDGIVDPQEWLNMIEECK